MNLISKVIDLQKRAVVIIGGETSNLKIVAGSIKAGAYDYILKPETPKNIKILEKSIKDYKMLAERVEKNKNIGEKLIGRSKEMVDLYKIIGKVAISSVPLLIIGEEELERQVLQEQYINLVLLLINL